ncbi:hypothetical protein HK103_004858 [Boothiomyces macroporosus]|uniref:Uncharacterized protein n=1 Tax=Boothiomyces macroporosus TaxID=261099 RepID=A0AAD5UKE5_9FUNG|nr:hypothetical protein HK103_004858 [Boothiomyces macroporosus]
MAEEVKVRRSLGVYRFNSVNSRGHEGTVYSLDVYWKRSASISASKSNLGKVTPVDAADLTNLVYLVSGSHDQSIILWEVQTNLNTKPETVKVHYFLFKVDQIRRLKGHSGDVYALEATTEDVLHRTGNLVSGGDYSIKTWNTETGTVMQTLHGHTGYVSCIKVRGKRVFSGSWDTTVRSWNIEVFFANSRPAKECMCSKGTKIL